MIATYEFYEKNYYGDVIPVSSFPKYESRAEDVLAGMMHESACVPEEYLEKAQKAICALAEVEYQIDTAMQHSGTDESGKGKIVKSVSSGSESISYDTGSSIITAVLTDTKAQEKLKYDTARKYLSGTGLLYWGV